MTLEAFAETGSRTFDERRLAVAPDGRHVYVVQPHADDLLVFRHDRAARRLRLVERHANRLGGVEGLDEPSDVAVSPSGLVVYAAGRRSDAVAVFTRDPESGKLTFQGPVYGGPGIDDDPVSPQALAVSSGNRHVYVTSERLAAVTALALDCLGGFDELCLDDGRFRVEVAWRDGRGEGAGHPVPLHSRNSGLFWFFGPDNWEMLVKVLDGCGINDRFWVFAATTNVGYTLRVTDVETGAVKEYVNPLGVASPSITDTGAFETCP